MRSTKVVLLSLAFGFGPVQAQTGSPAGAVPVDLLQERRERLLDRIGDGVVVLRSARTLDMEGEDYAQTSDFRQDNDFFYLTGLEIPGSWLVLIAHSSGPDEVILYVPPRNATEEQWTGPRLSTGEAAKQSGIRNVKTNQAAAREINAVVQQSRAAYTKVPRDTCTELDGVRVSGLRDIRPHMAALRLIKDEDELRRLQKAIEITAEAQREAMKAARPGMWEYEIEALIEYTFHRRGAERVGFPSIVGSGPNSTVLHYDESRRRTEAGDLMVIDVGAEFGYYTADITRTIPVSGKFTQRQRALYDLVLGAQQAAIQAIRPGTTLIALEQVARDYMRRNSGELCGRSTCDEYFVHGLSHWLGMDVHDPAEISTPLAAGMVLTVEPGLYIAAESIGIRIEDDVLVTQTGHQILSTAAPRTAAEIEQMMAGQL